jgi:hypothetical protein
MALFTCRLSPAALAEQLARITGKLAAPFDAVAVASADAPHRMRQIHLNFVAARDLAESPAAGHQFAEGIGLGGAFEVGAEQLPGALLGAVQNRSGRAQPVLLGS